MPYPIIACLTGHSGDDATLYAARQKAGVTGTAWCVVFLKPSTVEHSLARERRILLLETKVRALGGSILQYDPSVESRSLAVYLNELGKDEGHGKHLFVGYARPRLWAPMSMQTPKWLQTLGKDFILHRIVFGNRQAGWWRLRGLFGGETARDLLPTIFYVGGVTLALQILGYTYPQATFITAPENVSIIYLIACMVAAILHGLIPGLITGLTSIIAVNYYFTPPYNTFYIEDGPQLFQAILFLVASIVIALIASGARYNVFTMRQRERQMHTLLYLSRTLNLSLTRDVALEHIESELRELLHRDVVFFLPAPGDVTRIARRFPERVELDTVSQAALNICWFDYVPTGAGTDRIEEAPWRFQPMLSNRGFTGALGLNIGDTKSGILDGTLAQLLEGLADLSATILERIDITSIEQQTKLHQERDKMHSMMMSSVSHDLKTPLASVIGSLNAYHSMRHALSEEQQHSLLQTAQEEAVRLDHFITNILDLAKLENFTSPLRRESADPMEIVNHVVKRLGTRLAQHRLRIDSQGGPFDATLDVGLTSHTLYHLLDNAVKYSPYGSTIHILLTCETGMLTIRVRDEGPGIAPEAQSTIFNKYTRLKNSDRQIAGTGLGLTIARLAMEMQGGILHMENHPNKGAIFMMRLPCNCHVRPNLME